MPNLKDAVNYASEFAFKNLMRKSGSYISKTVFEYPINYYLKFEYDNMIVDTLELKSTYAQNLWYFEENLDSLYQELNREIAPLKENNSVSHTFEPWFSFKKPFVAEVPNITIAGHDALAVTSDGRILIEPTYSLAETHSGRVGKRLRTSLATSPISVGLPIFRRSQPKSKRNFETATVLYTRYNNYYHWMIDQALKIRGIKKFEEIHEVNVQLIIPSNPPPYVYDTLDLLDYNKDDYIEWDRTITKVESLITPSFPDPTPQALYWLRDSLNAPRYSDNCGQNNDIIYISRQKSNRRKVHNFDEIRTILDKYGIEIVYCEEMSLQEQIRRFSQANGIISPHGAGLTNMIWSEDMTVVELFNSVVRAPFYVLAHVLGHEYVAMHGPPIETKRGIREHNLDFEIDVEEFEHIMNELV